MPNYYISISIFHNKCVTVSLCHIWREWNDQWKMWLVCKWFLELYYTNFSLRNRTCLDKEKVRSRMVKKAYWHVKQLGSLAIVCQTVKLPLLQFTTKGSWSFKKGHGFGHRVCHCMRWVPIAQFQEEKTNVGKVTFFLLSCFLLKVVLLV